MRERESEALAAWPPAEQPRDWQYVLTPSPPPTHPAQVALPSDRRYHAVATEALITNRMVHHLLLFACRGAAAPEVSAARLAKAGCCCCCCCPSLAGWLGLFRSAGSGLTDCCSDSELTADLAN